METSLRQRRSFKMTPSLSILLGFAGIISIGAFLLCLPISNVAGEWIPFIDALFTSTTSVCVTGLMVFDIAFELTIFAQIVVMLLIQIGGLGFVAVTSFLFIIIGKKLNYSTRIALQESLSKEDNQGVVSTVIKVLVVTLICELVGFLLLVPSMVKFSGNFWSGTFMAMFLAISAFCNAGIDPFGKLTPEFSNMAKFADNSLVLIPVMLLIVVGGIGSIVLIDLFDRSKKPKRLMLHTRVVLWITLILILLGAGVFAIFEWNNAKTIGGLDTWDKIVNCFFQSVTTRTAGFATFDQSGLNVVSAIMSSILMFIGGAPVSMAGGVKVTVLFVLVLLLFKGTNQNGNIIYKNKKITHQQITKAIKIVLIAIMLLFVGALLIFVLEGEKYAFGAVVYEVISASCTVGLSFGITPALAWHSKLVLVCMMYIGRIGMLTIPLAFKTKDTTGIEYVEAKIIVG